MYKPTIEVAAPTKSALVTSAVWIPTVDVVRIPAAGPLNLPPTIPVSAEPSIAGRAPVNCDAGRLVKLAPDTVGSVAGLIQDVILTEIPNSLSVGGSIRVGSGNTSDTEELKVLGIFPRENVVRIQRHTGIAHTAGSNVDALNNTISIPVKTTKFESEPNQLIYFNVLLLLIIWMTPPRFIAIHSYQRLLDLKSWFRDFLKSEGAH